ncbi:putative Vacuolar protein sorting-associated protein 13C [Blattamonas nauphoetae]|uniref:Vacuolar protein sorting-associated protein 13C n=1 Tax=Blattamonas nauphoetae TaxID=2049346 RepID=A0ABQ9WUH0_9EUKA|nr:putative Vacuolar protein sorting-associated protein 13C [Blattamonas nauphoetae]
MLEAIVAKVLGGFLGKYCSNFDRKSISIGWSGVVELKNLRLRPEAFHEFHEGLRIVDGIIGKLYISLSLTGIMSKPINVQIEDVSLIVAAEDLSQEKSAISQRLELKAKQKFVDLDKAEQNKAETAKEKKEPKKDKAEESDSFLNKLIAKVIINCQISIRNIHIRYEDTRSPQKPVVFGVILEELDAHSTDSNWNKAVNTEPPVAYKMIHVKRLAAYHASSVLFDPKNHKTLTDEQLKEEMRKVIQIQANTSVHTYVLDPATLNAKFSLSLSSMKGTDYSRPLITCDIHLSKLSASMASIQIPQLMSMTDFLLKNKLMDEFQIDRPSRVCTCPDHDSPTFQCHCDCACVNPSQPIQTKRLWIWAKESIAKEIRAKRRPFTSAGLDERIKDKRQYIQLYKGYLESKAEMSEKDLQQEKLANKPLLDTFSPSESSIAEYHRLIETNPMHAIELKYSTADILYFRSIAEAQITAENTARQKKIQKEKEAKQKQGWFGRMFGKKPAPTTTEDEPDLENMSFVDALGTIPEDERKSLVDQVVFDSSLNILSGKHPKDFIIVALAFNFDSIAVVLQEEQSFLVQSHPNTKMRLLKDSPYSPLLSLSLQSLGGSFQFRPHNSGIVLTAQLGDLCLRDEISSGSPFTTFISCDPSFCAAFDSTKLIDEDKESELKRELARKQLHQAISEENIASSHPISPKEPTSSPDQSPLPSSPASSIPLLSFSLNLNPLDSPSNVIVGAALSPLNVLLPTSSLSILYPSLMRFSEIDPKLTKSIADSIKMQYATLQTRTSHQLVSAMDHRQVMDLNCLVSAPRIAVPFLRKEAKGRASRSENESDNYEFVVVDLGELSLVSKPSAVVIDQKTDKPDPLPDEDKTDNEDAEKKENEEEEPSTPAPITDIRTILSSSNSISEDTVFDRFDVSLKHLSVFFKTHSHSSPDLFIRQEVLTELSLSLKMLKSIAPDDLNIPRLRLLGELPALLILISPKSVSLAACLVGNILPHFEIFTQNDEEDTDVTKEIERLAHLNETRPDMTPSELDSLTKKTRKSNTPLILPPEKRVDIDVSLTIGEISMAIQHKTMSSETENHHSVVKNLLVFSIQQVDVKFVKRPFDQSASVTLKSILLTDTVAHVDVPIFSTLQRDAPSSQTLSRWTAQKSGDGEDQSMETTSFIASEKMELPPGLINALELINKINETAIDPNSTFVQTAENTLSLVWFSTNNESPSFQNVGMNLDVVLAAMTLNVKTQSLTTILKIVLDYGKSFSDLSPPKTQTPAPLDISTPRSNHSSRPSSAKPGDHITPNQRRTGRSRLQMSSTRNRYERGVRSRQFKDPTTVKMKIHARIGQICVIIPSEKTDFTPLFAFTLSQTTAKLSQSEPGMKFEASLGALNGFDLSGPEFTLYPHFLLFGGPSMPSDGSPEEGKHSDVTQWRSLTVSGETSQRCDPATFTGTDMMIRARVHHLKVVAVMDSVNRILSSVESLTDVFTSIEKKEKTEKLPSKTPSRTNTPTHHSPSTPLSRHSLGRSGSRASITSQRRSSLSRSEKPAKEVPPVTQKQVIGLDLEIDHFVVFIPSTPFTSEMAIVSFDRITLSNSHENITARVSGVAPSHSHLSSSDFQLNTSPYSIDSKYPFYLPVEHYSELDVARLDGFSIVYVSPFSDPRTSGLSEFSLINMPLPTLFVSAASTNDSTPDYLLFARENPSGTDSPALSSYLHIVLQPLALSASVTRLLDPFDAAYLQEKKEDVAEMLIDAKLDPIKLRVSDCLVESFVRFAESLMSQLPQPKEKQPTSVKKKKESESTDETPAVPPTPIEDKTALEPPILTFTSLKQGPSTLPEGDEIEEIYVPPTLSVRQFDVSASISALSVVILTTDAKKKKSRGNLIKTTPAENEPPSVKPLSSFVVSCPLNDCLNLASFSITSVNVGFRMFKHFHEDASDTINQTLLNTLSLPHMAITASIDDTHLTLFLPFTKTSRTAPQNHVPIDVASGSEMYSVLSASFLTPSPFAALGMKGIKTNVGMMTDSSLSLFCSLVELYALDSVRKETFSDPEQITNLAHSEYFLSNSLGLSLPQLDSTELSQADKEFILLNSLQIAQKSNKSKEELIKEWKTLTQPLIHSTASVELSPNIPPLLATHSLFDQTTSPSCELWKSVKPALLIQDFDEQSPPSDLPTFEVALSLLKSIDHQKLELDGVLRDVVLHGNVNVIQMLLKWLSTLDTVFPLKLITNFGKKNKPQNEQTLVDTVDPNSEPKKTEPMQLDVNFRLKALHLFMHKYDSPLLLLTLNNLELNFLSTPTKMDVFLWMSTLNGFDLSFRDARYPHILSFNVTEKYEHAIALIFKQTKGKPIEQNGSAKTSTQGEVSVGLRASSLRMLITPAFVGLVVEVVADLTKSFQPDTTAKKSQPLDTIRPQQLEASTTDFDDQLSIIPQPDVIQEPEKAADAPEKETSKLRLDILAESPIFIIPSSQNELIALEFGSVYVQTGHADETTIKYSATWDTYRSDSAFFLKDLDRIFAAEVEDDKSQSLIEGMKCSVSDISLSLVTYSHADHPLLLPSLNLRSSLIDIVEQKAPRRTPLPSPSQSSIRFVQVADDLFKPDITTSSPILKEFSFDAGMIRILTKDTDPDVPNMFVSASTSDILIDVHPPHIDSISSVASKFLAIPFDDMSGKEKKTPQPKQETTKPKSQKVETTNEAIARISSALRRREEIDGKHVRSLENVILAKIPLISLVLHEEQKGKKHKTIPLASLTLNSFDMSMVQFDNSEMILIARLETLTLKEERITPLLYNPPVFGFAYSVVGHHNFVLEYMKDISGGSGIFVRVMNPIITVASPFLARLIAAVFVILDKFTVDKEDKLKEAERETEQRKELDNPESAIQQTYIQLFQSYSEIDSPVAESDLAPVRSSNLSKTELAETSEMETSEDEREETDWFEKTGETSDQIRLAPPYLPVGPIPASSRVPQKAEPFDPKDVPDRATLTMKRKIPPTPPPSSHPAVTPLRVQIHITQPTILIPPVSAYSAKEGSIFNELQLTLNVDLDYTVLPPPKTALRQLTDECFNSFSTFLVSWEKWEFLHRVIIHNTIALPFYISLVLDDLPHSSDMVTLHKTKRDTKDGLSQTLVPNIFDEELINAAIDVEPPTWQDWTHPLPTYVFEKEMSFYGLVEIASMQVARKRLKEKFEVKETEGIELSDINENIEILSTDVVLYQTEIVELMNSVMESVKMITDSLPKKEKTEEFEAPAESSSNSPSLSDAAPLSRLIGTLDEDHDSTKKPKKKKRREPKGASTQSNRSVWLKRIKQEENSDDEPIELADDFTGQDESQLDLLYKRLQKEMQQESEQEEDNDDMSSSDEDDDPRIRLAKQQKLRRDRKRIQNSEEKECIVSTVKSAMIVSCDFKGIDFMIVNDVFSTMPAFRLSINDLNVALSHENRIKSLTFEGESRWIQWKRAFDTAPPQLQRNMLMVLPPTPGESSRLSAQLDFQLSMDFFNGLRMGFEPLIEPIILSVGINPSILPALSLIVSAGTKLLINLTPQTLSTLGIFLQGLESLLTPQNRSDEELVLDDTMKTRGAQTTQTTDVDEIFHDKRKSTPFLIANRSGLPFLIGVPYVEKDNIGGQKKAPAASPTLSLPAGQLKRTRRPEQQEMTPFTISVANEQVLPFDMPWVTYTDPNSDNQIGSRRVNAMIEFEGYQPFNHLNITNPFTTLKTLKPIDPSKPSSVIRFENMIVRGRRILLVSSTHQLVNKTTLPITLKLQSDQGSGLTSKTLQPNESFFIPLDHTHSSLLLKPERGSKIEHLSSVTDWSYSDSIPLETLQPNTHTFASSVYRPQRTDQPTLTTTLSVSARSLSSNLAKSLLMNDLIQRSSNVKSTFTEQDEEVGALVGLDCLTMRSPFDEFDRQSIIQNTYDVHSNPILKAGKARHTKEEDFESCDFVQITITPPLSLLNQMPIQMYYQLLLPDLQHTHESRPRIPSFIKPLIPITPTPTLHPASPPPPICPNRLFLIYPGRYVHLYHVENVGETTVRMCFPRFDVYKHLLDDPPQHVENRSDSEAIEPDTPGNDSSANPQENDTSPSPSHQVTRDPHDILSSIHPNPLDFRLDGCQWTQPLLIQTNPQTTLYASLKKQRGDVDSIVTLNGITFLLNIDLFMNGNRLIQFYSSYWVVNETFLPLVLTPNTPFNSPAYQPEPLPFIDPRGHRTLTDSDPQSEKVEDTNQKKPPVRDYTLIPFTYSDTRSIGKSKVSFSIRRKAKAKDEKGNVVYRLSDESNEICLDNAGTTVPITIEEKPFNLNKFELSEKELEELAPFGFLSDQPSKRTKETIIRDFSVSTTLAQAPFQNTVIVRITPQTAITSSFTHRPVWVRAYQEPSSSSSSDTDHDGILVKPGQGPIPFIWSSEDKDSYKSKLLQFAFPTTETTIPPPPYLIPSKSSSEMTEVAVTFDTTQPQILTTKEGDSRPFKWSGPISVDFVGETAIFVPDPSRDSFPFVLRLQISQTGRTGTVVTLLPENSTGDNDPVSFTTTQHAIINRTQTTLRISQKKAPICEKEGRSVHVRPNSTVAFARFDGIEDLEVRIAFVGLDKVMDFEFDRVREYGPFVIGNVRRPDGTKAEGKKVFVTTYPSGRQFVMEISYEKNASFKQQLTRSMNTRFVSNSRMVIDVLKGISTRRASRASLNRIKLPTTPILTPPSPGDEQDLSDPQTDETPFRPIQFFIRMAGLGISVITAGTVDDRNPVRPSELVYLSFSGLSIEYTDTRASTSVDFRLGNLQLDDQNLFARFPVVLGRSPVGSEKDKKMHQPIIQGAFLTLKGDETVTYIKGFNLLLQKLELNVEQELIMTMIAFYANELAPSIAMLTEVKFSKTQPVVQEKFVSASIDDCMDQLKPVWGNRNLLIQSTQKQYLFAETFLLQPIKINMSISISDVSRFASLGIAKPLLDFISTFLLNLDNAEISLSALSFFDLQGERSIVMSRIIRHYTTSFIVEFYKLVGSMDAIGNPLGLVRSLSSGIQSLVYEPYSGLVDGPAGFAFGLTKGMQKLLSGSVGAVLGSAGKITDTLATGVSKLSGDDEYIKSRQKQKQNKKPKHAVSGLVQGVAALGSGVIHGITGIFLQPIRGARRGGMKGALKGVGKGVAGLFVRPTAGLLDMASLALEGIRNTGGFLSGDMEMGRARAPRYVSPSGLIEKYSEEAARAYEALMLVGKLKKEEDSCTLKPMKQNSVEKNFTDVVFLLVTTDRLVLYSYGAGFMQTLTGHTVHTDGQANKSILNIKWICPNYSVVGAALLGNEKEGYEVSVTYEKGISRFRKRMKQDSLKFQFRTKEDAALVYSLLADVMKNNELLHKAIEPF